LSLSLSLAEDPRMTFCNAARRRGCGLVAGLHEPIVIAVAAALARVTTFAINLQRK